MPQTLHVSYASEQAAADLRGLLAEATIYFGQGFLMTVAMIGDPAVAVFEGLLLLLTSRILGRRTTLVCLGTNALFSTTRSASRILWLLAPPANRTNCAPNISSRCQIAWTTFCSAAASACSTITRCTRDQLENLKALTYASPTPLDGGHGHYPQHQTSPQGKAVIPRSQPWR